MLFRVCRVCIRRFSSPSPSLLWLNDTMIQLGSNPLPAPSSHLHLSLPPSFLPVTLPHAAKCSLKLLLHSSSASSSSQLSSQRWSAAALLPLPDVPAIVIEGALPLAPAPPAAAAALAPTVSESSQSARGCGE